MPILFENLDVYQKSLAWTEKAESICHQAKKKASDNLIEQFSRAALSIPLNLAEGNGRWHKPDRKQFYWVARGSVFECIPILHVLNKLAIINDAQHQDFRNELDILAKMLTALIKSVDEVRARKADGGLVGMAEPLRQSHQR